MIVAPAFRDAAGARGAAIVSADPYLYFARLTQWWAERTRPPPARGVHASAVVDPARASAPTSSIGAVRGDRGGRGARRRRRRSAPTPSSAAIAGSAPARASARASRCCSSTTIGARGIVHPGAVLGADGFGFAPDRGRWEKIEQLGRVVIGDDVEIGANTCIDRGALGDTVIGDGVKIDNLVQIGHNVRIGDAHRDRRLRRHRRQRDDRRALHARRRRRRQRPRDASPTTSSSAARPRSRARSPRPGFYSGSFPFDDNASWEKNAATLRNLHALRERVRALEKKSP